MADGCGGVLGEVIWHADNHISRRRRRRSVAATGPVPGSDHLQLVAAAQYGDGDGGGALDERLVRSPI